MAFIDSSRWNTILTKLNQKTTDAGKSPLSANFDGYIKQSHINMLRNGTNDILGFYQYNSLEEALHNVGYLYANYKTWDWNFIATTSLDEIEKILDTMELVPFPSQTLHANVSGAFTFPHYDYDLVSLPAPYSQFYAEVKFQYYSSGSSYGSYTMDANLELIVNGCNVNWSSIVQLEIRAEYDDLDASNLRAYAATYENLTPSPFIEHFIPPHTTVSTSYSSKSGSTTVERFGTHT